MEVNAARSGLRSRVSDPAGRKDRGGEVLIGSWACSPGRRRIMVGNKGRDTTPELRVRHLVHSSGLRYRVAYRPEPSLRRTADLTFTRARVVVFVDGCFWHSCSTHGSQPRINSSYWLPKLARNRERDAETDQFLTERGWIVLRIWEHEDAQTAANRIRDAVLSRKSPA